MEGGFTGAVLGPAVGAVIGTFFAPGIGTAAGAMAGLSWGAPVGAVVGGAYEGGKYLLGSGGGITIEPGKVQLSIDGHAIAEAVIKYIVKGSVGGLSGSPYHDPTQPSDTPLDFVVP